MNRRTAITGVGLVLLAGCGSSNDDARSGNTYVVARPYESPPEAADTTSIDDPKLADVEAIQRVVEEAIDSSTTAEQLIEGDEREEVTDVINELPRYEGNDEYQRGAYVTRDSEAAVVYYERED